LSVVFKGETTITKKRGRIKVKMPHPRTASAVDEELVSDRKHHIRPLSSPKGSLVFRYIPKKQLPVDKQSGK